MPVDVALVLGDVDAVHRVLPGTLPLPLVRVEVPEAGMPAPATARLASGALARCPPQDARRHARITIARDRMMTALDDLPVFSRV